jgi:hypothetical protein
MPFHFLGLWISLYPQNSHCVGCSAYSEAEPLYRYALDIGETQLGANHPNTNITRSNLEDLLSDMKSRGGQ